MGDHFDVIECLLRLPALVYDGATDTSDRLNFVVTTILVVFCSLIITIREYLMDPISCYLATDPGGQNFLKYAENFCWTEGTMSLTNHHQIPQTDSEWEKYSNSRLHYYQWVPIMLLVQSGMFHLPHLVWSVICYNFCGININGLITKEITTVEISYDERNDDDSLDNSIAKSIKQKYSSLSVTLFRYLVQNRGYQLIKETNAKNLNKVKKLEMRQFKTIKSWIFLFYIITKLMYILNSIGQIFIMQKFLQLDSIHGSYSSWFGLELLHDLATGQRWPQTGAFPRSAYCMVRVTLTGGTRNTQVAQCVLTANMFIEKIYVFLWFWIFVISVLACGSFLLWIFRIFGSQSENSIKRYLELQGSEFHSSNDARRRFCSEFLGRDGRFLICMISLNRGDVIAGPLVCELFRMWNGFTLPSSGDQRGVLTKESRELLLTIL